MLKQIKNPLIVLKKNFLAGQLAQPKNDPDNFFKTLSGFEFGPAKNWPSQNWSSQNFKKFGWAKNGCDWPSQMGFSPTLVFKTQPDPKTRKKSGSIVCYQISILQKYFVLNLMRPMFFPSFFDFRYEFFR